jgi:hypothetical protein
VKQVHLGLLGILPLLVSCDPVGFHAFQPEISGHPVSSSRDQRKLLQAVAETARQHGLKGEVVPDTGIGSGPTSKTLASYKRGHMDSNSMTLLVKRNGCDGSYWVQIYEATFLRKEPKQIEAEIHGKLN